MAVTAAGMQFEARNMNRMRMMTALLAAGLSGPAAAADLAITGNYGNAAGCRQAATGNVDSDQ